jgi:hypothetical protein
MDLQLYFRVLWRFRLIVGLGLVLALSLTFLSIYRVSAHGIAYRKSQLYETSTQLLITQHGFPWGRATAQGLVPGDEAKKLGIPFADSTRFSGLAFLYASLVESDAVRAIMLRDGPLNGEILAAPVVVNQNVALPLLNVTAIATTPIEAVDLAARTLDAFESYLSRQQALNDVPQPDRVVVQEVARPRHVSVFQGRSKTMPIVIFLGIFLVTIATAFVLENLRPRVRQLPMAEVATPARRSA